MGLFTCMCKLTKVISSCDDIADMNEFDDSDGESDDDSCDSAYNKLFYGLIDEKRSYQYNS